MTNYVVRRTNSVVRITNPVQMRITHKPFLSNFRQRTVKGRLSLFADRFDCIAFKGDQLLGNGYVQF